MEELLPFILLWIIITIFNLLSKRLKKAKKSVAQSATPEPSSTPRGEIPPLLQEILGAPKREEGPTLQNQEKFEEDKDEEESTEAAEDLSESSEENRVREELRDIIKKVEETKDSGREKIKEEIQYRSGKKKLPILKTRSLKTAVIWKEILDKPISLRRIGQGRNTFLK
jgi:hypothetical protein